MTGMKEEDLCLPVYHHGCLWTHMDGRPGHVRGQLNELCSRKNIGADAVTQLYQ